jgi:hypothetical protein
MKHVHFVIYRLKSIIIYLLLFFSDCSLPLSRLIFPNLHEEFKLEGRKIIFQVDDIFGDDSRSLILKEAISDGIYIFCISATVTGKNLFET